MAVPMPAAGFLATVGVALVTLVAPPSAAAAGPALTPRLAGQLQAVLDRERASLGIPGLSVAVIFPDGTTWTGVSGSADVATGRPVLPETPFALASVSKAFVAGVVMGLVEERRLHLGDSVARLLPDVRLGRNGLDPRITVRQLLDHTSGLADYLGTRALEVAARAAPTARWTAGRALSYVPRPRAEPGVAYYYSNTNYVLLGLIVERVTGRTLAEELRSRWIEPLGLRSVSYQGVEPPVGEPARAYRFSSDAIGATTIDVGDGTAVRPYTAITTAAGAAGSIMANAEDAARWLRALLSGERLRSATVARMVADAGRTNAIDPLRPYGLGLQAWAIGGHPSLGHSGRLIGQRVLVRHFPDDGLTIAVLTNQSRADPAVVLEALLAVLLRSNADAGLQAA